MLYTARRIFPLYHLSLILHFYVTPPWPLFDDPISIAYIFSPDITTPDATYTKSHRLDSLTLSASNRGRSLQKLYFVRRSCSLYRPIAITTWPLLYHPSASAKRIPTINNEQ